MTSVEAIIHACYKDTHKALVALGGMCGLRVGESLNIKTTDFTFDADGISLSVFGKGYKTREVPVSSKAWTYIYPAYMEATLERREVLVPIDERAARRAIKRSAKRAGFDISSHQLRHTYGTVTYETSGNDIMLTKTLMGHSNTSTTEKYTEVTKSKMRATVEGMSE